MIVDHVYRTIGQNRSFKSERNGYTNSNPILSNALHVAVAFPKSSKLDIYESKLTIGNIVIGIIGSFGTIWSSPNHDPIVLITPPAALAMENTTSIAASTATIAIEKSMLAKVAKTANVSSTKRNVALCLIRKLPIQIHPIPYSAHFKAVMGGPGFARTVNIRPGIARTAASKVLIVTRTSFSNLFSFMFSFFFRCIFFFILFYSLLFSFIRFLHFKREKSELI